MEQEKKDFGFIKNILNNSSLLRWVKKFSADGLQEENVGKNFNIETDENSITIADTGLVKMFFSSARFDGTTYASFDIKHIKEVLSLVEGEGRLIINESDDKRLCYVQSGNNVIVIAPTSESEMKDKKVKKEKKEKKKSETTSEEDDEECSNDEE